MDRALLLFAATFALGLVSAPVTAISGEGEGSGGGPFASRQLQGTPGTPGTCIEVHQISGFELEDDQDQTSLQVSAAVLRGTTALPSCEGHY